MSLATNNIALARRLLTKYGRAISLTRVTEGVYNVATGATAASSTTNYSAKGYPDGYNSFEADGTLIRLNDTKLWISTPTTGEVPEVGDTLVIDSKTLRIMNVGIINAQGVNVLYKLQCRI